MIFVSLQFYYSILFVCSFFCIRIWMYKYGMDTNTNASSFILSEWINRERDKEKKKTDVRIQHTWIVRMVSIWFCPFDFFFHLWAVSVELTSFNNKICCTDLKRTVNGDRRKEKHFINKVPHNKQQHLFRDIGNRSQSSFNRPCFKCSFKSCKKILKSWVWPKLCSHSIFGFFIYGKYTRPKNTSTCSHTHTQNIHRMSGEWRNLRFQKKKLKS